MAEETVTISKAEYDNLRTTEAHMDALEILGVDNWQGYIGRYNDCDECGEDDLSWALEKCPRCDEKLEEPFDLI